MLLINKRRSYSAIIVGVVGIIMLLGSVGGSPARAAALDLNYVLSQEISGAEMRSSDGNVYEVNVEFELKAGKDGTASGYFQVGEFRMIPSTSVLTFEDDTDLIRATFSGDGSTGSVTVTIAVDDGPLLNTSEADYSIVSIETDICDPEDRCSQANVNISISDPGQGVIAPG